MLWAILQLLISIGMIMGGLSGDLVLRGTNSSGALVVVGLLWLCYDIYNIIAIQKNKKVEDQQSSLQGIKESADFLPTGTNGSENSVKQNEFCTSCGAALEDDSEFCSSCGAKRTRP